MIEILIIIAVVRQFRKLAEAKKLNPTTWAWIGALSYYIPILLMSFLVFPMLINTGLISFSDETMFSVYAVLGNLAVGIIGCFIAYTILKNRESGMSVENTDILDADLD